MKKVKKEIKPMERGELTERCYRHLVEIMCDIAEYEMSNDNEDFFIDINIDGNIYKSVTVFDDDFGEGAVDEDGKIKGFSADDLLNRRINKIMNNEDDGIYAFPGEVDIMDFIEEYYW